jgi:hypothetical protein
LVVTEASLPWLAASTPRRGNTDNLTEALSGSNAAVCRSAERRPTASPQRAIKVEIVNVEMPCLLLSPGFYYKTNAHYAQLDFDGAMLGARKCVSACAVQAVCMCVCACVV